jgi:limonene-1,2-epoxide hydrolase
MFLSKLSPTAVFRFGATDEVMGKDAISAVVAQFFTSIGGVRHELTNVIAEGHKLACEGNVTYTRIDATTLTLPFANVFEFDGDLIAGYRIYVDIAPLYGQVT